MSPVAANTLWPCAAACWNTVCSASITGWPRKSGSASSAASHLPQLVEITCARLSLTIRLYASYSPLALFGASYETIAAPGACVAASWVSISASSVPVVSGGAPPSMCTIFTVVVQAEAREVLVRVGGPALPELEQRDRLALAGQARGEQVVHVVEAADLARGPVGDAGEVGRLARTSAGAACGEAVRASPRAARSAARSACAGERSSAVVEADGVGEPDDGRDAAGDRARHERCAPMRRSRSRRRRGGTRENDTPNARATVVRRGRSRAPPSLARVVSCRPFAVQPRGHARRSARRSDRTRG